MAPIIEAKSLSYSYDKKTEALSELSFSVEEGRFVSIIGHNGSGKSTLAKILMGLLGHFGGEVFILGKKLDKDNLVSIRQKVGIVFQNPDNQFVGSTVADDIAFGLENKQVPHEEMQSIIESVAKDVGMLEFLDHEPQNLSGGQKQRVAIAGVLAMKPDIVIFDEATAMLDPKGKREIRELIAKMKQENPKMTILSITHDVEEAYQSDQVLVLNEGKLLLSGSPKEVFAKKETLRNAKLDIPFFLQLKEALEEKGLKIPDDIQNEKELEDYLW